MLPAAGCSSNCHMRSAQVCNESCSVCQCVCDHNHDVACHVWCFTREITCFIASCLRRQAAASALAVILVFLFGRHREVTARQNSKGSNKGGCLVLRLPKISSLQLSLSTACPCETRKPRKLSISGKIIEILNNHQNPLTAAKCFEFSSRPQKGPSSRPQGPPRALMSGHNFRGLSRTFEERAAHFRGTFEERGPKRRTRG